MKTLKIILICSISLIFINCGSDKNSLDKEYVLNYLKQSELEQPIIFKNSISTGMYISSPEELNNTANPYYSKLYNQGYLKAEIRTDIPNPESLSRPYKIVLTKKAEPFILEKKSARAIMVASLEFNAIEVKEIRIVSDFKAEVDVVYKKTKTPFYNSNGKDLSGSGKEYPYDTYDKKLEFRKNSTTNEWKLPIKIMF